MSGAESMSSAEFVPLPVEGRRFRGTRPVRLGDANGTGRLCFDALARYLQDVATDDAVDAELADGWVLRKVALRVDRFPQFRDQVDLVTWCSGIAATAAERRTSLRVGDEVMVDAVALWVFVGRDGRPLRLDAAFFAEYGITAANRRISTRLRLPDVPTGERGEPWPLRAVDVDVLEHVNNSVSLAALEDAVLRAGLDGELSSATVEVEYRAAIDPGDAPELVVTPPGDPSAWGLDCWLVCEGTVRTSMRLRLPGPVTASA